MGKMEDIFMHIKRIFPSPGKGLIPAILTLAWPTILEQILQTAVQYADSAMVGQLGPEASAAVGITTTPMWLVNSFFLAAGIGVLAVTARAVGAQDYERAGKASVQAIFLNLFLSLSTGALGAAAQRFSSPMDGSGGKCPAAGLRLFFHRVSAYAVPGRYDDLRRPAAGLR